MNSREKMRKAISFEEGPIPLDIGANPVTGVHCSIVEKLRAFYGLGWKPVRIVEPYQMLGMIEDDLKQVLGVDTDCVWSDVNMFGTIQDGWKEWTTGWGQKVLISGGLAIRENERGDRFTFAGGDESYPASAHMSANGFFFDSTKRQKEIVEEDLDWKDNVEEYKPISDRTLAHYAKASAGVDDAKWIVGNFGGTAIGDISMVPGASLKDPKGIRDVEEWYVSTLTRQDYLRKIFGFQTDVAIENLKRIKDVVGDKVDTVYVCGADLGTQRGPLCSVPLYRSLFMPYHKKVNDWIHENTPWSTFKHSCGSVEPFIPSFIEAGFDILNPVQWTAEGMDRETLKSKYRGRIVFWGGGVDTQGTLPFGSPAEVKREVLETCRIFGKGGGFVFNTIHNIQALSPIENIIAMFEALRTYNEG